MPTLPTHDLLLRELHAAVKAKLDADAWFDQILVLTEERGDLDRIVSVACAKLGSCVLIETPVVGGVDAEVSAIFAREIPVLLTVFEYLPANRETGGTEKHALDTAQVIAAILHQWHWYEGPDAQNFYQLTMDSIVRLPLPPAEENRGRIAWQVLLTTQGAFCYTPEASEQYLGTNKDEVLLTNAGLAIDLN